MITPNSSPLCVFQGDPNSAADAERFIQTTLAQPQIMAHALGSIKITSTGELMYGVPNERDASYDPALADCIGAIAIILRGNADRYLCFDEGTMQLARLTEQVRLRRENTLLSQQKTEAIGRLSTLAAYASRLDDPYGTKAQARALSRYQQA